MKTFFSYLLAASYMKDPEVKVLESLKCNLTFII